MREPASRRHLRVAGVVSVVLLICSTAGGCASSHTPPRTPPTASPGEPAPEASKSFVIPAIEVLVMDFGINRAGYHWSDRAAFDVTSATIRRNLKSAWVVEDDPFEVNQFLHPYQGAMYHDIARSTGLNYWQAMAYTFAGSALWEIAGETTRPSKNDQIASGIAGSFLGEPLFRTSRLILFHAGHQPGFLRALAATVVSPPTGVNHMLFGNRFGSDAPGSLAPVDLRLELGVTATVDDVDEVSALRMTDPFIGFTVDYGFPGQPSYSHSKPFDYFRLEGIASSGGFQSLATRGVIVGQDYGVGERGRGVWGLYGGYDYFVPDIFRVSSTGASLGTTLQPVTGAVTLQGTALLGIGYTAAQSIEGEGDRDYHYGLAPQALGSLRVIAGNRASLDLTAREYFISDVAGFGTRTGDVIFRGDATVAMRVAGKHGLAVKYMLSQRRATTAALPALVQRRSTIGLFYTYLGTGGFGTSR